MSEAETTGNRTNAVAVTRDALEAVSRLAGKLARIHELMVRGEHGQATAIATEADELRVVARVAQGAMLNAQEAIDIALDGEI